MDISEQSASCPFSPSAHIVDGQSCPDNAVTYPDPSLCHHPFKTWLMHVFDTMDIAQWDGQDIVTLKQAQYQLTLAYSQAQDCIGVL
jgi:hypothetical protein